MRNDVAIIKLIRPSYGKYSGMLFLTNLPELVGMVKWLMYTKKNTASPYFTLLWSFGNVSSQACARNNSSKQLEQLSGFFNRLLSPFFYDVGCTKSFFVFLLDTPCPIIILSSIPTIKGFSAVFPISWSRNRRFQNYLGLTQETILSSIDVIEMIKLTSYSNNSMLGDWIFGCNWHP